MGQSGGALRGPLHLLDVASHGFATLAVVAVRRRCEVLGDEGGVVEDDRQEVVEVVRHSPRQLAEALQPL